MLRNAYTDSEEIKQVLERFQIGDTKFVDVTLYEALTPDSFIWRLQLTDGVYYLYAEDYVPSLVHVKQEIERVAGTQTGTFVAVKTSKEFADLQPVQVATTYRKPEVYDKEMKQFAADSGFDLVFLYKVTQQ